jgi:hypothetical protein
MRFSSAWRVSLSTVGTATLAMLVLAMPGRAVAQFSDSFTRADSPNVGNGWIEKSPESYTLSGNRVQKIALSSAYLNNVVYRPASEDLLDVEASVEFRLSAAAPGYPQIFTRLQSATVANSGQLDGYIIYVSDNNGQAILGRQLGSSFVTTLANIAISPALNTADTFRMRLRTTGTNPVLLNAYIERWNGSAWALIGSAAASDSAAERIATAGSVGFGGYIEGSYTYDNFVRTDLGTGTPNNPVPTLTQLQPASATQGENGLTLTVTGTNFVNGAVVRWNGANRTTTFVSSAVLEAQITAADLGTAGTAAITVFNPAPGGGASAALNFTIQPSSTPNPVPTLSGISPTSAVAGGGALTLTVNGSDFASNAVVRWNGANRTTTFVSPTQLTAAIPASDLTTAGSATVTVFNPTPGGGTSSGGTFTIVAGNPVPAITSLSPTSTTAGSAAFTLTVDGTGFVNGSTVRWNGSSRTTTFVSATRLTASITAADVATAGTAQVSVFTGAPGGGTSANSAFTISASGGGSSYSITSLSPISAAAGAGSVLVTVNGSGFTSQSVVRWNGSNRTTTFLSATQIRATLSASDMSTQGSGAITVNTPSVGITEPLTFFVLAAGENVVFDGFNRANSATIGNGWTEKYGPAFRIEGNRVLSAGDTYPYAFRDNITYRTSTSEDRLNAESSIEFIRTANSNFPQLHARVQRGTINNANTLNSYILYVDDYLNPEALVIAVQPDNTSLNECYLSIINFTQPLVNGTRYRLRLIVQGTSPVQLTGLIERFDGSTWLPNGSGSVNHVPNMTPTPGYYCPFAVVPPPIVTAGTYGFAKWYDPVDAYDNFYWRSTGGSGSGATLPSLTTLSPNSATVGAPAFTLTVNGSGFQSNSVVRWNGADRATTFISATELRASIAASDVAATGTASVVVFNPGTGGGVSLQSLTFSISPPPQVGSFTDEFNRADSDILGNQWIEKSPAAFFVVGNAASKQSVSTNYTNNLVYRPASEDVLNVEASAVLRLSAANPGYPQIFTRLQSGTAATQSAFDAYLMFVDGSTTRVVIGRQQGSGLTSLASMTLTTALNTNDTFRMRLSTTGTATVQLQGFVERLTANGWEIIGQAAFSDTSAQRIATAGSVGFGGYTEAAYSYDSFTRTNLP